MTTIAGIKRTLAMAHRQFEEAMTGHLTFSQYQILDAVRSAKVAPKQADIIEATLIDRSTSSDIIRRLCKRGLLNRKRNKDDAREYLLTVSKEGFDMLSVADKHLRRIERSLSLKEAA